MNLAAPDVRTLEIHAPAFDCLTTSCRRPANPRGRELATPLLIQAIRDAAELGYNFLSIAGEQSVFHPDLKALCREAHRMHMLTTLTTRCGLLSARRLKSLAPSIDLLGIRFEAGMARNLEPVRRSRIPFALVFHLTAENMGELEQTAAFAATHGAVMLHVIPAEALADHEMATLWMMMECLRDMHRGELAVQLDVWNRYNLPMDIKNLEEWRKGLKTGERFVGELVSPLVVEEDGTVSPLRQGFPRELSMGNLAHSALAEIGAAWIRDGAGLFGEVYRTALGEARLFDDLSRLIAAEARRHGRASFSAAG